MKEATEKDFKNLMARLPATAAALPMYYRRLLREAERKQLIRCDLTRTPDGMVYTWVVR